MSDTAVTGHGPGHGRPRTRQSRQDIILPDGEVLTPRAKFANNDLGVSDRTAARMNLETTYVGGVAYVLRNASLRTVAERVARRNQPRRTARGRS